MVRISVRKSAPGRIIRTGPDFGPDFINIVKIKNFESDRIFQQFLNPEQIPDRTESWSGAEFGPVRSLSKIELFSTEDFARLMAGFHTEDSELCLAPLN